MNCFRILVASVLATAYLLPGCGGDSGSSGGVNGVFSYIDIPISTTGGGPQTPSLDFAATVPKPARGVLMELLSADGSRVLATTATRGDGSYDFGTSPAENYFVRAKSQLLRVDGGTTRWDFRVVDDAAGDALYSVRFPPAGTLAPGTAGPVDFSAPAGYNANGSPVGVATGTPLAQHPPRPSGAFAILDAIKSAVDKIVAAEAGVSFPQLNINWNSTSNRLPLGSFYDSAAASPRDLTIAGMAELDTDEYDSHIVVHEFGHYVEAQLSRSDSIGGVHTGDARLDPRVAFGEGFGNALSGMMLDDPTYSDTMGPIANAGFNLLLDSDFAAVEGFFNESSVQEILYDLYDGPAGDDDAVALGFAPIWNVLRGPQRTTQSLTSIFSFIHGLRQANPAQAAAIGTVLMGEAVDARFVDDFDSTGVATNDPAGLTNFGRLYTALPLNTATRVCSTDDLGTANKLYVRRFLRLQLAAPRQVTITVTPGNSAAPQPTSSAASVDPQLSLFTQGSARQLTCLLSGGGIPAEVPATTCDRDVPGKPEIGRVMLEAGSHVVVVANVTDLIGGADACMDVSAQ